MRYRPLKSRPRGVKNEEWSHLIGGLTALVPSRRSDIVTLGTRAIVSGTLATSMTGAVIGLIT